MTRLERLTTHYWQLARLARHERFFDLVVRGLDGLTALAGTAPSYRLAHAAVRHVGVAARAHAFPNADALEKTARAAIFTRPKADDHSHGRIARQER